MKDVLILIQNSYDSLSGTCREKCVSYLSNLCNLVKLGNLMLCFCKALDFLSFQFGPDSFGNFFEFMNTSNSQSFASTFFREIHRTFGVMAHIPQNLFFPGISRVSMRISSHECCFFGEQDHFLYILIRTFSIE